MFFPIIIFLLALSGFAFLHHQHTRRCADEQRRMDIIDRIYG